MLTYLMYIISLCCSRYGRKKSRRLYPSSSQYSYDEDYVEPSSNLILGEADYEDDIGYERKKRFYPLEFGCIKGYLCCEIAECRPYCALCEDYNSKIL